MYRTALVALKPESTNDVLLAYAVELARQRSLRLAGIAVLDRDLVAPPEPVPLGGMAFKIELDESRIADARARMSAALSHFSDVCAEAGIDYETAHCENTLGTEIAHVVQRYDLLLVGHTTGTLASGPSSERSMLDSILRRCPRPAIVVGAPPPTRGSVVVAYDGSLQAARAVQAFVSGELFVGNKVFVTSFHHDPKMAEETASLAQTFLRSHNYAAELVTGLLPANAAAAELITDTCEKCRAVLLVMGAYGQGGLREFFFGSVTKSLLARGGLPILLDH